MSKIPPRIIVVPFPPVLPLNPYLDSLYAPMRGLNVCVRRGRLRSELARLLIGRGPRVLHLHFFDEATQRPSLAATTARSLGLLMLVALLRLCGVRIVWTAHNIAPHEAFHTAWSFFVYRVLVRWSDALIFHSAAARDLFVSRYGAPRHSEIIPHGNYIGQYGPIQPQAEARAALDLPSEGPLFLAFGALRPYKNVEGLIDAFAALPVEQRGTLLAAGVAKSEAYGAAIERRAANVPGVIIRRAFIPDSLLSCYLGAADVVVLPYRTLLTSGVLLCALSYARPVVAPNNGPVRELVRDGVEGWLFAPDHLNTALACVLADPNPGAMRVAALARAEEFDWPAIAGRTAQVYTHVCR